MTKKALVRMLFVGFMMVLATLMIAPFASAQDEHAAEAADGGGGIGALGLGIGAGLAVGLAGLGTGLAQSGVGAGGTGALAEKPELFGNVLILFAIPETIVLFGFVIGILLFTSI